MLTVHQVAERTGVSIRTLHYYDEMGLLRPDSVTEAGYRMYDNASLERLQLILFFRELQFPLKEIREILDRPNFDRKAALKDQVEMLRMQRAHLDKLIELALNEMKGETNMKKFEAFDRKDMEAYAKEAKERWGNTEAYQAFEEKKKDGKQPSDEALYRVFQGFAELMKKGVKPESEAAEAQAVALELTISENYYPCNKEILGSLGQMYVGDERFRKNIDRYGEGTAEFAAATIRAYCAK